jgi:DNA-binding transcriptional LysR family regulator
MLVSSAAAKLPAHLSLKDCREKPFVLISRDRSPTLHQHAVALCARHGFHPRTVQEVPEVTTALALVRAGLGLGIIPQSFGTTHFAGLRFHTLREAEARWKVGAAWRRNDTNPLLLRFLAMLQSEVRSARLKSLPSS